MNGQAYLFRPTTPPVVPEEPAFSIPDNRGLIYRVGVPSFCVAARSKNGIGAESLPMEAVPRPCHADLRAVFILEANVEHHVSVALPHNMASRHLVTLPPVRFLRRENRVACVLGPVDTIHAQCISDAVRLVLISGRIPHLIGACF